MHDCHYVEVNLDVTVTATGNKLTVTYDISETATCTCQLDSGTPVTCKVSSFVRCTQFKIFHQVILDTCSTTLLQETIL